MEEKEEFKMLSTDSEMNQRISPILHNPSSSTQRTCIDSSMNLPETSLVTHSDVRNAREIMDEADRFKKLPKPIGYEMEQKMARMNYSLNRSETSSARCTEGLLNDFDWHNCETKKEIERIKMSSKHTDYELKQKMAFMDHSVNRSETSFAKSTEKSLPAESQLDEAESRKSFTDNQIDALNFQLKDLTVTTPTPSTNVTVTIISTVVSDDKPLSSTFPGSDRISPNTDVTRTAVSDTQSTVVSTTVREMQQTYQLSTVISAKTTKANVSTSNWNQFAWNPDAPPFVPHNSTYNYNVGSQNHHSTLYAIGTSDAPIIFIPSYITTPGQMQTSAFADQQTLSGQNMLSVAYAALPQMFSSGHANAYNAAIPINYNTPVVQNVPNSVATTITAANYLIGSQQIYSNVNGSGYITYVPSYYSAPAVQNMSNIAAPVTTAANYLIGSQQIYSNVNRSGYGTCVPSYYSAPDAAQNMPNIAASVTSAPNYLIRSQQIYSNVNGSGYGTYVPSYYSAPNMTNVAASMTTAANYPVQSQQIYSNVNGSGYGTYVPPYYYAPVAQNMTNVAAPMTTAANYPVQSQQIYSNVSGSGYGTYVPPYYNAPAAHTRPNFVATMQNAANRQENMQMNRYSVSMSISYNTSQYQYTASGQSSIAMAYDPQSIAHPFIAPAAAPTSFSQLYQTYT